jgi:hypothetical protein
MWEISGTRSVVGASGVLLAIAFACAACPRGERGDSPATAAPVPTELAPTWAGPAGSAPTASARASAIAPTPSASAAPPTGPVLELEGAAWSRDKKRIATIVDRKIHLWGGETKEHLREIEPVGWSVGLVFSPDGSKLYVAHELGPPAVFEDLEHAGKARYFELPGTISRNGDPGCGQLAVSDDGAWLAGRCNTVNVCLWATKTGKGREWQRPASDAGEIKAIEFDRAGRRITVTTEGKPFALAVPGLTRLP